MQLLGLDGMQWFLVLDVTVICTSVGIAGALFIKLRRHARAQELGREGARHPAEL